MNITNNNNNQINDDELKTFRNDANRYLVESGERDRLIQLMNEKLKSCDWQKNVNIYCRELLNDIGIDNITIDQFIENVTPKAKELVPNDIKTEIINNIQQILEQKFNVR